MILLKKKSPKQKTRYHTSVNKDEWGMPIHLFLFLLMDYIPMLGALFFLNFIFILCLDFCSLFLAIFHQRSLSGLQQEKQNS